MLECNDDDENIMRILLATDNHIGYMEKDAVRGNDSLVTFEEILQIAQEKEVDFILLGGDLFHENKPSRKSIHGTMSLLRRYCYGDRPCGVEFLSDQSINFGHTDFPCVNYEDPNLNIAIPVFSIHGNHDDPAGQGNLCTLDILASAGLVNYFGKYTNLDKINVSPLLLQKGGNKLALYGLGAIGNERLHHLMVKGNVQMLRPREDPDSWFNLFVLHQNHAKHGPTNYIPEQFLGNFLDLVFWGHEHECKIKPEWNGNQKFHVIQPGSSIATSLSEGETRPKAVGLLSIRGKEFKIDPIPLRTVRQFYMEDIVLSETSLNPEDPDVHKQVEYYLTEKVEHFITKAGLERSGHKQQPKKPLIRLRVDYTGGFDTLSVQRFGQKFVDRVANPRDILHFIRRRITDTKKVKDDEDAPDIKVDSVQLDATSMEDMVKEYFSSVDETRQMALLTERGLCVAVKEFVEKEEKSAIEKLVEWQLDKTQKHLRTQNLEEDVIDLEISRYRDERESGQKDDDLRKVINEACANNTVRPADGSNSASDQDGADDGFDSAPARGRGSRGRGRGRGAPAKPRGRGSRGGRGRKAAVVEETPSIRDSFSKGTQRQKRSQASSRVMSSDEDIQEISDDDSRNSRSSRKGQSSRQNGTNRGKRGAVFEDSSDGDDSFDFNPTSKRRKR